ncbi:unnamed protein product [Dovyalis caffra]|uniref:THIF-type NAD/FAD binding fold domain-containing protein n=1 Tax=Dovyalis caffra TaxID=77055 RepID=A0AAV1SL75_9ROSI|nr:unnamed protein product [Dovyalis caffra]
MGTRRACLRSSGAAVLPFQVVNHGPPPTSTTAMSLIMELIICPRDCKIKMVASAVTCECIRDNKHMLKGVDLQMFSENEDELRGKSEVVVEGKKKVKFIENEKEEEIELRNEDVESKEGKENGGDMEENGGPLKKRLKRIDEKMIYDEIDITLDKVVLWEKRKRIRKKNGWIDLSERLKFLAAKFVSKTPIIASCANGIMGKDALIDEYKEVMMDDSWGDGKSNSDFAIILTVGFLPGLRIDAILLVVPRKQAHRVTIIDHCVINVRDYVSSVSGSTSPLAIMMFGVFGSKLQKKLEDANPFIVRSGALGCEFLKNLAMMGVSCGEQGKLTINDDDVIEKSNLSRQFLFRDWNIGQAKSTVAASTALLINPHLNIEVLQNRVGLETENVFDDTF